MADTDSQLVTAVVAAATLVAGFAMVWLGLAKRRLDWRVPYCRVCRQRHRGACKIRLTL